MTTETLDHAEETAPEELANVVRLAVRQEMERQGLGIRALARAAGISHGGLSDFLNEKKNAIQLDTVAALAQALKVPVARLIGEAPAAAAATDHRRHDQIAPDPDNPRGDITEDSVKRMSQSIDSFGLLAPLRIKPDGGLIYGERRWRAIGRLIEAGILPADWPIPVVFGRETAADKRLAAGLVENMQREDLAPIDEARAIRKLVADHGWTTARIAEAVGSTQRHIQLRLDLVDKLAPAAQQALEDGKINLAAARALTATTAGRQETALTHIANGSYGWETAAKIKKTLQRELVPVGRNLFPLEEWEGEIIEDPDDPEKRYFTDRGQFLTLQRDMADRIRQELEAKGYAWVRVVDHTNHDDFRMYHLETDKSLPPDRCGAVVEIQYDLSGVVHKGLYDPDGIDHLPERQRVAAECRIAAEKKQADAARTKAGPEPAKITQKHMILCRQMKTDTLQAAIAARPDIALRAAVLGLLADGCGAVRIEARKTEQKHDKPETDTLADAAAPWAETFDGLEYSYNRHLVLSVSPHDTAKQVKAWEILCDMDDTDVAQLHAVLVAQACGSWSGMAPNLGDGPVACAIADTLDITQAATPIDEAFLKTCGRPQLLQILEAGGSGHDLKSAKMKDLIALALADVEAGNLADWKPPTLRFGSPEAIEKLLPRKGE